MKKLLIALLTITTLFSNEEQFSISDYLKDNFLKYFALLFHINLAYTVAVSSVDVEVINFASIGMSPFNHVFVINPAVKGNPMIDNEAIMNMLTNNHSGTFVGELCSKFFESFSPLVDVSVENKSVLHIPCCIA